MKRSVRVRIRWIAGSDHNGFDRAHGASSGGHPSCKFLGPNRPGAQGRDALWPACGCKIYL